MKSALSGFAFFGLGLLFTHCTSTKPEQPNLVFIIADQYRASAVGFEGREKVKTPNLDQLASEGVHFTNAVSTIPICSPYRAMLMTGNYYTKNNVPTNCLSPNIEVELRQDDFTLLDGLNSAGYDIAYIGKWHLEYPREPYVKSGNNFGPGKDNWDEWTSPERRHGVKFWYAYNTWDDHFKPHYWDNNSDRDNRVEVDGEWSPVHEANRALEFIKNEGGILRDNKKPFAVFLSFNPPHTAYHIVPEEYKKMYENEDIEDLANFPNLISGSAGEQYAKEVTRDYYACISGVDEQCGRIMKYLKESGLDDQTIFIFTSDHGNCTGIHNHHTKGNHFEESFRVPLIMKWKGKIPAGTKTEMLFSPVDFFPTLMGMIGQENLVPLVHGKKLDTQIMQGTGLMPEMALYARLTDSPEVKRYQKDYFFRKIFGERGVRTRENMLVINKRISGSTQIILYDLVNDPHQLRNIAEENMDLVMSLWKEQLDPALVNIEDGWHATPVTDEFDFPEDFRPTPNDHPVWARMR
jgi:arylsulfatase A-like enzyme